jgi:type II secretory pathway component PulK
MGNSMRMQTCSRRGILILAVLACLTLVTILAGVWLRMLTLERQQARSQQFSLQAEYLADSAMRRATAKLAANGDYRGETWEPSADELGLAIPAKVTIEVETDKDDPQGRSIRISAELAGKGPNQALRRKQQTILLSTKEPTP